MSPNLLSIGWHIAVTGALAKIMPLDFPDIVVIPKTTEEMVRIAEIAYQYEIPIVPFGGGTGMGGG